MRYRFIVLLNLMLLLGNFAHAQERYALLVGCTEYPNLEDRFNLVGPANDVVLCRKLLTERFGFEDDNIVTLADSVGTELQAPTRANISREWGALGQKVKAGDQVFVLMAGHGTQAPASEDDETETDGLDELFLPRDVGPWNDTVGTVENAIKDDEIREWVAAIREKQASLWVIIDACHSGTMTRDAGDEIKREIRPDDLGIPDNAAESSAGGEATYTRESQLVENSETTRGVGDSGAETGPVTIALYAAQSIEPTVEKKMPRRGANRQYYGLLTYTMNEILTQSQTPLSYRQLVQQIHRKYVQWGRVSPTPVLEGSGLDLEILGNKSLAERPNLLIQGNRFTGYEVNAGSLNGLTVGSILAAFPPAGEANSDKPIGHVRILDEGFSAVKSKVEACEHDGLPAPEKLDTGMTCKPVYLNLGDQRLKLAADPKTDDGAAIPEDDQDLLESDVQEFAEEHNQLVASVEPKEADWLLRYRDLENKDLFLTPAGGWHGQVDGQMPPLFGPAPEDEDQYFAWLENSLTRIARVQSLLKIAGGGDGWSDLSAISVDIVGFQDATDRVGTPIQFESDGLNLYNGDRVGFRVKNTGTEPQDVTILLIDSGFGINVLYPTPGATNRLFPGNEVIKKGRITAETTGLEHLVVIAMKGKPVDSPVDFSFLAQPTLERSRAAGGENLQSPLGKVLQTALYGDGNTRGFASDEVENYQIKTLSWQTRPNRK